MFDSTQPATTQSAISQPATTQSAISQPAISQPVISQPAISILIPVYNVQDYLKECLDSVCAQTFGDFEAVCINDGSTDNSREIIENYVKTDARFRIINKSNSGYGASMNCGLDAAQGTYIAILESDDFLEPQTLKNLYDTIEEFDAEVVKANCYFYWVSPRKKNVVYDLVPHTQTGRLINPQNEHQIFYLKPAVWAALYRKSFLTTHDIRFCETPGASYQDTAFNFKIWANAQRAVFIKDAFVHYRQDNQSSSVKSLDKVYYVCHEFAEMDRYVRERSMMADWLMAVKCKMKFEVYLWNYERLADEFQWEFLQRFATEMKEEVEQGHIDWRLFEDWNRYDLQSILHSPDDYHHKRLAAGRDKFGKALYYLKSGGVFLIAKVIRSKLFHRY